ncbi:MAG TPA: primosomal protein N' [Candidatus Binataceae bacterium]|nr:primosomal protein N' [Candidatus Binataceae bacterium]
MLSPMRGLNQLTYLVPPALANELRPGHRVLVPMRGRRLTAIVVRLAVGEPQAEIKPILELLEPQPTFDAAHLKLLEFMAVYYQTTLAEAYRAVMPGLMRVESQTVYALARPLDGLFRATLSAAEQALVAALGKAPLNLSKIGKLVGAEHAGSLVRRWLGQGLLERREGMRGRHREQDGGRLRRLAQAPTQPGAPPSLTPAQQRAIDTVVPTLTARSFRPFLLWGITASGKTEVYLRLVAQCLHLGRRALVLVPEIALTDHLVQAFTERFGSSVVVAHSGLKVAERWSAWSAALGGQARVLLGPRSALFAPIHDLGLVVVDEEHDPAYKQEEGIRYHARDLAVALAQASSCPVVLGSATPAAESFANARNGRYQLLRMGERIHDRPLAEVEVVDLRRQPRVEQGLAPEAEAEGAPIPLSVPLVQALSETLTQGGQSLVFVNRRGFHNFLHCQLCGNVLSCPDCSVSMTFHLRDRSLRCHYCGHYRPAPEACPECRGLGLQGQGFGTERLHAALQSLLPQARVERMDSDTSRRQGARQQILRALAAGEVDILVGTQMITKGFDFPGVTLVAVVAADLSLNLPDFRSAERTFQLLTQAAGRAGRGPHPGRVIIQTYSPHHYSIRAAQRQDYAGFMRRELQLRRKFDYPPFSHLAMVRLEGTQAEQVEKMATFAAELLARAGERVKLLGPAPAPIERIKQRYRWQLMLKAPSRVHLREPLLALRRELAPRARRAAIFWSIDIDPVHML